MENTNTKSRRNFLRKVAYVAPSIIVLGSLTPSRATYYNDDTHYSTASNLVCDRGDNTDSYYQSTDSSYQTGWYNPDQEIHTVTRTSYKDSQWYTETVTEEKDSTTWWTYFSRWFS